MPDIVLYDRVGAPVTYPNADSLTVDTPVSGETAEFTYGELLEGVAVEPDFSGGDQTVTVPEGYVVRSATVKKPANLIPDNIRYGEEVAGILGTLVGDTEEATVPLSMADGDQVIVPSAEGKVLSKVTVQRPETLVPGNIAAGVNIGGVVGTFGLDAILRYFDTNIDLSEGTITLIKIYYDRLYADNGSYDVTIPDTICGLQVVIAAS